MTTEPDLTSRPLQLNVEQTLSLSPQRIYAAWTEHLDQWFAAPGTVSMTPAVGAPFFFETHFDGQRHPHYGRFLQLEHDKHMKMTWVTGNPGTNGAETVVTVDLKPAADGTNVSLQHAGFADEETMEGHRSAWPEVLLHLEKQLLKRDGE